MAIDHAAWVASHRSSLGYDVRPAAGGIIIGWVFFDRETDPWSWAAWCWAERCDELGTAGTKAAAAELVAEHWRLEHP